MNFLFGYQYFCIMSINRGLQLNIPSNSKKFGTSNYLQTSHHSNDIRALTSWVNFWACQTQKNIFLISLSFFELKTKYQLFKISLLNFYFVCFRQTDKYTIILWIIAVKIDFKFKNLCLLVNLLILGVIIIFV